mgnify:CR=1 FL=1
MNPMNLPHFHVYRSVLIRDSKITREHPMAQKQRRNSKDIADVLAAGKILGIPVKDHIILELSLDGHMAYDSFADEGCLS